MAQEAHFPFPFIFRSRNSKLLRFWPAISQISNKVMLSCGEVHPIDRWDNTCSLLLSSISNMSVLYLWV